MEQRIARKISGYKQQDERFEIYSATHSITATYVKDLMAASMNCTHCLKPMLTEYEARHPQQWTVDRIDNRLGHNVGNVVLCCLKCNLKRRNRDMHKFRFSQQLQIVKLE